MRKPVSAKFTDMVWRLSSGRFEVRSLPKGARSPEFYTRQEAEKWLAANAERLGLNKAKRGPRKCMCCQSEFQSEGFHNRLCNLCRSGASGGSFHDPVRPVILRRA